MQWIIGDIHGCYYTLQRLLEKVRAYDDEAQFVFIGDYVDRGLRSLEVVNLVIEEQKKGAYCLRGNHDDVIDWMVNGQSAGDLGMMTDSLDLLNVGAWWLVNGFAPTLTSYGVKLIDGMNFEVAMQEFVNNVPDNHKKFFRELHLYWENDTHFACHAYLDPTIPLPRTLAMLPDSMVHDMLWTRFPSTGTGVGVPPPVWDKIGVFGHSPVQSYGAVAPIKHGNIRLIDTFVFSDAYLTSYCCDRDDWILQATDSRDIQKVR